MIVTMDRPAFLVEHATRAAALEAAVAVAVERMLPDLTLIGPARGAELRAMVYGGA